MRKMRTICAVMLTIALLVPATVFGAFNDTSGHWAAPAIDQWTSYGVISGYPNGGFGPNDALNRADVAVIMATMMKLQTKAATNPFTDVSPSDYYYDALLKCYAAGYISGYGDGTFRPATQISTEQYISIVARVLKIPTASNANTALAIANGVSPWAAPYMYGLINAGYITGVPSTALAPTAIIDRASVVYILGTAVTTYAYQDGATVTASGNGITLVVAQNVTVKGTVNNLIASGAAANSKINFVGATVKGTIYTDAPAVQLVFDAASSYDSSKIVNTSGTASAEVVNTSGATDTSTSSSSDAEAPKAPGSSSGSTSTPPTVTTPTPTTYTVSITLTDGTETFTKTANYVDPTEKLTNVFYFNLGASRNELKEKFPDSDARRALDEGLEAYAGTDSAWRAYVEANMSSVEGDSTILDIFKNKSAVSSARGEHELQYSDYEVTIVVSR